MKIARYAGRRCEPASKDVPGAGSGRQARLVPAGTAEKGLCLACLFFIKLEMEFLERARLEHFAQDERRESRGCESRAKKDASRTPGSSYKAKLKTLDTIKGAPVTLTFFKASVSRHIFILL